jgi:hypothetical protein
MMFRNSRISILSVILNLLFVLNNQALFAQNFMADFTHMQQQLMRATEIQTKTVVHTNDPDMPTVSLNGQIFSDGKQMKYIQEKAEIIHSSNYLLIVDHEEKTMILDTATQEFNAPPLILWNLDTAVLAGFQIKLETKTDGTRVYTLSSSESEFEKIVVSISKTGLPNQLQMYMGQQFGGGYATVKYTNIVLNGQVDASHFNVFRYVIKTTKGYKPAKRYEYYTLESAI